jgi:hypothetical protein
MLLKVDDVSLSAVLRRVRRRMLDLRSSSRRQEQQLKSSTPALKVMFLEKAVTRASVICCGRAMQQALGYKRICLYPQADS